MRAYASKPCRECDEMFTPASATARYCSPECRKIGRQNQADPEANRALNLAREHQTYCQRCGQPAARQKSVKNERGRTNTLTPELARRGPPAQWETVFCSIACRDLHLQEQLCQNCGKSFMPLSSNQEIRCRVCRQPAMMLPVACVTCGVEFLRRASGPAKFCSPECKVNQPVVCRLCGEETRGMQNTKFCPTCKVIPVRERQALLAGGPPGSRMCCARGCSFVGMKEQMLDGRCPEHHEIAKRKNVEDRVRAHGLTIEQYDDMLEAQGGVCAVCGLPPTVETRDVFGRRVRPGLHIDHCHKCCPGERSVCGKCVRGLLCSGCNLGMGGLADNPMLLRAAADFIEQYERRRQGLALAA